MPYRNPRVRVRAFGTSSFCANKSSEEHYGASPMT